MKFKTARIHILNEVSTAVVAVAWALFSRTTRGQSSTYRGIFTRVALSCPCTTGVPLVESRGRGGT